MRNQTVSRQIQQLNNLFDKATIISELDIEILSNWGKYLCVLSAGLIENGIKEIYSEFVNKAASPQVANFAKRTLSKLRNPKTNNILELAGSFNNSWRDSLVEYVDFNGRREAIDSIMTNRHNIAHGNYSAITISRVSDYLKKAIQVIEFIENQCNN